MHALYLLSVWLHLLGVAVWVGGMAFLALVLVPVIRRPEHREQAGALVYQMGLRFRPVGWACLGLLVLTGTFNLYARGVRRESLADAAFWGSPFGKPLALKLGLVAAILVLSAAHDFFIGPRAAARWQAGASPEVAQRDRRLASRIGRLNMLLALLVVALGVMLVRGWPF